MRGSPGEMFDNFLQLSSTLIESAREWPIQLCSEYFTVLAKELVDIMLTRGFQTPLLVNLHTKS